MCRGAVAAAIAQPVDVRPGAALGDLADGEVELLAGDEIDRAGGGQAGLGLDRDLGAHEPDLELGVGVLQRLGDFDIAGEGRGRGVHDDQLIIPGLGQDGFQPQLRRRRVDQLAAGHQGGRLRQPRRKPERADLPLCLIARAGAAVEPVEGRRLQEQGLHHTGLSPPTVSRPPGSTRNS